MRPTVLLTLVVFTLTTATPALALRQVGLEETEDSRVQLAQAIGVPPTAMPGYNRGYLSGGVSVNPRAGLEEVLRELALILKIAVSSMDAHDISFETALRDTLREARQQGRTQLTEEQVYGLFGAAPDRAFDDSQRRLAHWAGSLVEEIRAVIRRKDLEKGAAGATPLSLTVHDVFPQAREPGEYYNFVRRVLELAGLSAAGLEEPASLTPETPLVPAGEKKKTATADEIRQANATLTDLAQTWGFFSTSTEDTLHRIVAVSPKIIEDYPNLKGFVGYPAWLDESQLVIVPEDPQQQDAVLYRMTGPVTRDKIQLQSYGPEDDLVLKGFEQRAKGQWSFTVLPRKPLVGNMLRDVLRQIIADLAGPGVVITDADLDRLAGVLYTLA